MTQCWANVLFIMQTDIVGPALNQRCDCLEIGQSTGSILTENGGLPHNRWCDAGPASGNGGPALYQHGIPKHYCGLYSDGTIIGPTLCLACCSWRDAGPAS